MANKIHTWDKTIIYNSQ